MSSLMDRLRDDMKSAMRSKDAERLSVVRMLISSVKYAQIDSSDGEMSDDAVVAVLRREAKKRRESIQAYVDGGREGLADKERFELSVIMEYLPKEMSEEEVVEKVKSLLDGVDVSGFGDAMKIVMKELKGKVDGSVVASAVKKVMFA